MTEPENFEYNDEFFLKDRDRERAASEYPTVWFAVYSKTMSTKFDEYDKETKALKLSFQWWGYGVVVLAVIALSFAALEPTALAHRFPEWAINGAAVVAALFGIASVLAGYWGMGISDRKMHWLRNRMVCEGIRQWRWQYYCAHIPEILKASGDPERERAYAEIRDRDFSTFVTELRADDRNRLKAILAENVQDPKLLWWQPEFKNSVMSDETLQALQAPVDQQEGSAELLVAAYDEFRIGAQKRYANYLVKKTGPFSTHPAKQKEWLHRRGVWLLLAIFGLHIAVVLGVLFPLPQFDASGVGVSAVILALLALGLRAVEDGLRPSEHLGRYAGYLAETSSIERAFDDAETALVKRNLMVALETAAYKEMVDFLQAGNRSRYVM
jgi:hypothetical protein